MKKIIFMAVLLTFSLSAAAQSYYGDDDVYDDYSYDISNDLDLTGEQWHTNEASILAANNSQYIVVRGPSRYRYTLGSLNVPAYEQIWHQRISLCRPYYYNGSLGWYVVAGLINYFIYPDGRWCRLSYEPYYYPYRYHVAHCRRINFYNWHFWHGRHHHAYHGTCYHHRRPAVHRHNGYNHYQEQNYRRQSPPPARRNYDGRTQRRYTEQQSPHERRVFRDSYKQTERSVRNNSSNCSRQYAPADRHRPSRHSGSRPAERERGRSGRH